MFWSAELEGAWASRDRKVVWPISGCRAERLVLRHWRQP